MKALLLSVLLCLGATSLHGAAANRPSDLPLTNAVSANAFVVVTEPANPPGSQSVRMLVSSLIEAIEGFASQWGQITGTLTNQTDLAAALDAKQPLDSDLTALADSGSTGTGAFVRASVTDAKQPLDSDLTALADSGSTGTGAFVRASVTDAKQPLDSDLTALASAGSTGTGAFVRSSITDAKQAADSDLTDLATLGSVGTGAFVRESAAAVPPAWGGITGTITSQTDLSNALAGKQATNSSLTDLASAGSTGTGAFVRASVTDAKQPLDSDLTALANAGSVGTGAFVRESAAGGGGDGTWGSITGTLADQTDLAAALAAKQAADSDLTALADSGSTGTGAFVRASVTDAKQPLDTDLTALASAGSTGTGAFVRASVTDAKQAADSDLTDLASAGSTGTGAFVRESASALALGDLTELRDNWALTAGKLTGPSGVIVDLSGGLWTNAAAAYAPANFTLSAGGSANVVSVKLGGTYSTAIFSRSAAGDAQLQLAGNEAISGANSAEKATLKMSDVGFSISPGVGGTAISGNVQIASGISSAPQYPLQVGPGTARASDPRIVATDTLTGTGAENWHVFVDNLTVSYSAGNRAGNSFDAAPVIDGSDAFDHQASFQSRPSFTGSGSLGTVYGLHHQTTINTAGTVAKDWGAYLLQPAKTGGGILATNGGVYIGPRTFGSTVNIGLQSDASSNYLAGVTLGTPLSIASGGTGAGTAEAALAALGGQPLDSDLTALADAGFNGTGGFVRQSVADGLQPADADLSTLASLGSTGTGSFLRQSALAWGGITGTLGDQTDLTAALAAKVTAGATNEVRTAFNEFMATGPVFYGSVQSSNSVANFDYPSGNLFIFWLTNDATIKAVNVPTDAASSVWLLLNNTTTNLLSLAWEEVTFISGTVPSEIPAGEQLWVSFRHVLGVNYAAWDGRQDATLQTEYGGTGTTDGEATAPQTTVFFPSVYGTTNFDLSFGSGRKAVVPMNGADLHLAQLSTLPSATNRSMWLELEIPNVGSTTNGFSVRDDIRRSWGGKTNLVPGETLLARIEARGSAVSNATAWIQSRLGAPGSAPAAPASYWANLTHKYSFETNNAALLPDDEGSANLTPYAAGAFDVGSNGVHNLCWFFDSVNAWATNQAVKAELTNGTHTIVGYSKLTAVGTSQYQMGVYATTSNQRCFALTLTGANQYTVYYSTNGTALSGSFAIHTGSVAANEWWFWAVIVKNGSYIKATAAKVGTTLPALTTQNIPNNLFASSAPFSIGAVGDSAPIGGSTKYMDEIKILDTELSQSELEELFGGTFSAP